MTTETPFTRLPALQSAIPESNSVFFSVDYLDKGVEKVTDGFSHGCWGCFYTTQRGQDKVGIELKDATAINYVWTSSQREVRSDKAHEGLVAEYFAVLRDAGVAQWLIRAPKTVGDMEKGCKISTTYPAPMVIGLLEMYRNAQYHMEYVQHVVDLRRRGMSAGTALLLPRVLHLKVALPNADAMYPTRTDVYLSDVFSERHIMACINHQKRQPFSKNSNFTGVFEFFNSGYSTKIKRLGYPLDTCSLSPNCRSIEAYNHWAKQTSYGRTDNHVVSISTDELHQIAAPLELTYERGHTV